MTLENPNNRGPVGKSRGGRAKGVRNKDKTELRVLCQEAVHEFTSLRRAEIAQQYRDGWRVWQGVWTSPQRVVEVIKDSVNTLHDDLGEDIPPVLLDSLQPEMAEFDPVVEMSVMASNYGNAVELRLQANANAAQYLRPKLKTVEMLDDPRNLAMMEEKNDLAAKMVGLLKVMADSKRDAAE